MSVQEIVELVTLGITALGLIISLISSLLRGNIKKFVIAKMEEAEKLGGSGREKLEYVLASVENEYKILKIFLNSQAFIEKVIDASKKINFKKKP